MARAHICDVPGCGRPRHRWQRLCDGCFSRLPGDIRTGIKEAFQQRRFRDHRQFKQRAAEHLAGIAPHHPHHVSPEQAFANSQRLLGER